MSHFSMPLYHKKSVENMRCQRLSSVNNGHGCSFFSYLIKRICILIKYTALTNNTYISAIPIFIPHSLLPCMSFFRTRTKILLSSVASIGKYVYTYICGFSHSYSTISTKLVWYICLWNYQQKKVDTDFDLFFSGSNYLSIYLLYIYIIRYHHH